MFIDVIWQKSMFIDVYTLPNFIFRCFSKSKTQVKNANQFRHLPNREKPRNKTKKWKNSFFSPFPFNFILFSNKTIPLTSVSICSSTKNTITKQERLKAYRFSGNEGICWIIRLWKPPAWNSWLKTMAAWAKPQYTHEEHFLWKMAFTPIEILRIT